MTIEERLFKRFGTSSINEILGEDVLNHRESIAHRLVSLGVNAKSVALWSRHFIPKTLLDELTPYQEELRRNAMKRSLQALPKEKWRESKKEGMKAADIKNPGRASNIKNSLSKRTPQEKLEAMHKRIKTNEARYGVPFPKMKTPEEIADILVNYFNIEPLEKVQNMADFEFKAKCLKCGKEFVSHFIHFHKVKVCPDCSLQGNTRLEVEIGKALEAAGLQVVYRFHPEWLYDETTNGKKEIDIYVPSLKLGFEINGAFSHNSGKSFYGGPPKAQNYHSFKTKQAALNGVRLFHIWEHWNTPYYDCTKYALAKCGIFESVIYARTLDIRIPSIEEQQLFYASNHRRGYCKASYSIALFKESCCIQCFSFVISGQTAELVRNATKQGTVVFGGSKRLIHHAITELKKRGVTKIVSFADRDITPIAEDSLYVRLGFTLLGDVGPSMEYWISTKVADFKANTVVNRRMLQKSKLNSVFSSINFEVDESLTEQQNLARLGIYPIYNSGCFKFELNI